MCGIFFNFRVKIDFRNDVSRKLCLDFKPKKKTRISTFIYHLTCCEVNKIPLIGICCVFAKYMELVKTPDSFVQDKKKSKDFVCLDDKNRHAVFVHHALAISRLLSIVIRRGSVIDVVLNLISHVLCKAR